MRDGCFGDGCCDDGCCDDGCCGDGCCGDGCFGDGVFARLRMADMAVCVSLSTFLLCDFCSSTRVDEYELGVRPEP